MPDHSQSEPRPPTEYGPWVMGNMGVVGRTVTRWVPSFLTLGAWMPVVDWEDRPDDAVGADESDDTPRGRTDG